MFEVHFDIGVGLVPQTANGPAGFPRRCHIGAGFGTGGGVIHDYAGAGVAVELKPAFLVGFFLQLGGALGYLLGVVLGFLLLGGELLDFLLRPLGAVFRGLCPVFGILQAFFQGDQTGFDTAEVRLCMS